jgi:hypothetical protein
MVGAGLRAEQPSNVHAAGPLLTGGKNGGLFAFTYKLQGSV